MTVRGEDIEVLLFTLRIATTTTLILIPPALGLAVLVGRLPRRFAVVVETVAMLPLVLPPTAVGYLLFELLSRRGMAGALLERLDLSILFTPAAVVIAASVMSLPLMLRGFVIGLGAVDGELPAVARTLGAGPFRAFVSVTLPLAWRGIAGGIVLAFCRALGEFGATIIVAGSIPGKTRTLALAIYHEIQVGSDGSMAMLLLFSVAVAFGAIAIATVLEGRRG